MIIKLKGSDVFTLKVISNGVNVVYEIIDAENKKEQIGHIHVSKNNDFWNCVQKFQLKEGN